MYLWYINLRLTKKKNARCEDLRKDDRAAFDSMFMNGMHSLCILHTIS